MKIVYVLLVLLLTVASHAHANPTAANAADLTSWMSNAPSLADYTASGRVGGFQQPPYRFLPPPDRPSPGGGPGPTGPSTGTVAYAQKVGNSAASWLKIVESGSAFNEAFSALSDIDTEFDPDFSPDGSPLVPSACAEKETSCGDCYSSAIDGINFTRFYLEKLRVIGMHTIDMADKAKKFGDNLAGVHGVSGLGWQLGGKPQIEEAVSEFRKTYDRKYKQYMRSLRKDLEGLAVCEAEHMDNPDWYARFGFMYMSFMEDRYRSPD